MLVDSSVGYFAYAQYDVLFASSFGGSVGEADDRGLSVILSASEISHRTIALLVVIARHEVPRQSP